MSSTSYVYCWASECIIAGPNKDPDGAKWNALCARLLPPDCVAVPVAELEALREMRDDRSWRFDADDANKLEPHMRALDALLSHLPPKVDHVAVLRGLLLYSVGERPSEPSGQKAVSAALEAAIAALEKDGR